MGANTAVAHPFELNASEIINGAKNAAHVAKSWISDRPKS